MKKESEQLTVVDTMVEDRVETNGLRRPCLETSSGLFERVNDLRRFASLSFLALSSSSSSHRSRYHVVVTRTFSTVAPPSESAPTLLLRPHRSIPPSRSLVQTSPPLGLDRKTSPCRFEEFAPRVPTKFESRANSFDCFDDASRSCR
jgi:hypothetical protein